MLKLPTTNIVNEWVIPCQINQEFRVTSQILTKLGVFVVPMGLISPVQTFSTIYFMVSDLVIYRSWCMPTYGICI